MNRFFSLLLTCSMLLTFCACATSATVHPPSDTDIITPEPIISPELTPPDASAEPEQEENGSEPEPGDEEILPQPEEPEEYIRTVDPYAPMVALTFDDGPHEIYSNQILDVLEQYHSVATFFEVGYNARLYPDVLRRMAELGCEIASHSNAHHDLTTLSKDALLTDLAALDKIIFDATGFNPTLVRPPYGAVNDTVKYGTGRAMVTWTVDTQDWRYRDAASLIEYIQNYGDLNGEIILMHSIHGSTAEAMQVVIPWLIEQGYQLVTVSELMAYYYGELLEANKFYNQTYFVRHDRTEYPLELPAEPMETLIPEFTVVPVVPIVPVPEETPPVDMPPEAPAPEETPPTDIPPAEGEDTPSEPEPPSEAPETPGETPETPGEAPEPPEEAPETPEEAPETPEETPETPEETPETPEESPEAPGESPEAPEESPEPPDGTTDPSEQGAPPDPNESETPPSGEAPSQNSTEPPTDGSESEPPAEGE